MKALEHIKKIQEYLDYVKTHILNIERAWEEVKEKCKDMRFIYDDYVYHALDAEVKFHDISKLSEHEFIQYQKAFYPISGEGKKGLNLAWKHHYENNPHHWENWAAKEYYNPYEAEIHCAHMVIDWLAMSYSFGDSPRSYYESNKEKIQIPEWSVKFIYEIFDRLDKA